MLKRLLNRIIEIQERRAQYYMLSRMTDRELNDIGIGRADIHRVVYGNYI